MWSWLAAVLVVLLLMPIVPSRRALEWVWLGQLRVGFLQLINVCFIEWACWLWAFPYKMRGKFFYLLADFHLWAARRFKRGNAVEKFLIKFLFVHITFKMIRM